MRKKERERNNETKLINLILNKAYQSIEYLHMSSFFVTGMEANL